MIRWEGYNADAGAAVRWHEMKRDAARADSFGVAERGNAVMRPQMTALLPKQHASTDLAAGLRRANGCAVVTGDPFGVLAEPFIVCAPSLPVTLHCFF